jgi:hypothetical protein
MNKQFGLDQNLGHRRPICRSIRSVTSSLYSFEISEWPLYGLGWRCSPLNFDLTLRNSVAAMFLKLTFSARYWNLEARDMTREV